MFSLLAVVFRFVFGKRVERNHPARVAYEVTTLVTYAGIPAVERILSEARETSNQELLEQFHLAQQELDRKNELRRRETSASRPVLEGSPTTWGWKVDHAAQLAAIQQGLEDAIDSTIFDPKQPPTGPNPLTGHMMKDMFYEYHDKHPQLRNLPASRRSTDELIWTIETFPNGSSKWKLTMSSSLAASVLSNLSENSSSNSSVTMADAPQQDNITPSISMKQATSIKSVTDDPSYNVWDAKASNRAHQSPSSYIPASSLTMLRTESPFQCDAGLERRSSMPDRSTRPALRAERSSRIPHVGSRTSLASESTTATAYSAKPTPIVSRNPSPARRPIQSKPKAPSRPRPKVSGLPAHHPPSASVTNSASTSRSSSPIKVSPLPSHVHTHRQLSSERHKPPPIPAPQTTLRSRPASQMSLRLQRPTSVASASRPATSRPAHSRTSSSESSHATDVTTGVALGPSRLGTVIRSGVARPNELPLRSMRSTTNLMTLGTGTSTMRGRTRSNTTSNATQTGSAPATSTSSADNSVKRGPGTGSMRPPPLPPARTGISRAS